MDEFASRGYPVPEDMRFQRRSWMIQRVGWLVLATIALAGLSGLLGNGPASWQQATTGQLTITYERFQRATHAYAFVVTAPAGPSGEIKLRFSAPFQRNFEFISMQPQALRSSAASDGLELTFAADAGAPGRIVIWARARRYGLSTITAAIDGAAPIPFWVFAYP